MIKLAYIILQTVLCGAVCLITQNRKEKELIFPIFLLSCFLLYCGRATLTVLQFGNIIDTVVHGLSLPLSNLPVWLRWQALPVSSWKSGGNSFPCVLRFDRRPGDIDGNCSGNGFWHVKFLQTLVFLLA